VYCGGVGNEARPSYGERGIFRAILCCVVVMLLLRINYTR